MKKYFYTIMALFILCSPLSSCSSDQEKKEKGVIEQRTDKVANEAVQAIKVPLDQAKIAAEQESSRIKQDEEQAKKQ
ncbi:MAG: hypothetical protein Q8R88_08010 [Desulfoprunum sp.]|nr:hypothetical protein [Desulfoprunum sp.]